MTAHPEANLDLNDASRHEFGVSTTADPVSIADASAGEGSQEPSAQRTEHSVGPSVGNKAQRLDAPGLGSSGQDAAGLNADAPGADSPLGEVDPSVEQPEVLRRVSMRANVATVGTTYINTVYVGDKRRRRRAVPTQLLAAQCPPGPFVPPSGFDDLSDALTSRRVIVITGPETCGKSFAFWRALQRHDVAAASAALTLPELDVPEIFETLEALHGLGATPWCLLAGADERILRDLGGSVGAPLRHLVSTGRGRLVVTTAIEPNARQVVECASIRLRFPDVRTVVDRYAHVHKLDQQQRVLLTEAVEIISDQARDEAVHTAGNAVGPSVVAALSKEVGHDPNRTAEELAADFGALSTGAKLNDLLAARSTPRDIAMILVGATLAFAPRRDIESHALVLADRLTIGERASFDPGAPPTRFAPYHWPDHLFRIGSRRFVTHFGVHVVASLDVCPPHRAAGILCSMWDEVDARVRGVYCAWLEDLGGHPTLNELAAHAAGALFTTDPISIEQLVLRRWASSEQHRLRRAAGLALGAAAVCSLRPAVPRALAYSWIRGGNIRQKQAGIAAFGSLLPLLDDPTMYVFELLRIAALDQLLAQDAARALGDLAASGADFGHARAVVLGALQMLSTTRTDNALAYGCLPFVVRALVSPGQTASASIEALMSVQEIETFGLLCAIMATAHVSARHWRDGYLALNLMVESAGRGYIDPDVVVAVIRGMKSRARESGFLPTLGPAVSRSLTVIRRESVMDDQRELAQRLKHRFFGGDEHVGK